MYIRTHCVSAILAQEYLSKNVCNPAGPYSCTTKTKLFTQTLLGLNSCMSFITIYLHIGMGNYFQTDFAIFVNLIYIYIYIYNTPFSYYGCKKTKKPVAARYQGFGVLGNHIEMLSIFIFLWKDKPTTPDIFCYSFIKLLDFSCLVFHFSNPIPIQIAI